MIWFLECPNIHKKELRRLEHGLLGLIQKEQLKLINDKDKPYFKKINNLFSFKFQIKPKKLYMNYDWMYKKYAIERNSMADMAKMADCSVGIIYNWLIKHGIQIHKWLYSSNEIENKTNKTKKVI